MPSKFHPALLQLVALSPVLWWFGKRLNDGNDEPLGLLTFALALVLAWRDRKSLHASPRARICGAALVLSSVIGIHWLPPMIRGWFAIALVIPANTLRAALLAVKEIGHLPELLLGHSGIGLASFAIVLVPLWFAISSRARPAFPATLPVVAGRKELGVLVVAAVLAPLLSLTTPRSSASPEFAQGPAVFTFDGLLLPLHPLPASEAETCFPALPLPRTPTPSAARERGRDRVRTKLSGHPGQLPMGQRASDLAAGERGDPSLASVPRLPAGGGLCNHGSDHGHPQ